MNSCYYRNLSNHEIHEVLEHSSLCFLGVAEKNQPYVIPMYYTYKFKDGCTVFSLKSCNTGMKTHCIQSNEKVCLTVMDTCGDKAKTVVVFGFACMKKENSQHEDICDDVMIYITACEMSGREYCNYCVRN